jgi:hypothetical protein
MELLERIGQRIERLSPLLFAALLFVIVAVRSGISPIGSEFVNWLRISARIYPEAESYLISSPLPLGLMKALGYPGDYIWWAFGFAVYLVWVIISVKFILREFTNNKHLALAVFFLSTPVSMSLSMLGHIDIYTLIGATIAVWGRFSFHIFVGALVTVGGNSDQSLASIACLIFLAVAGSAKARKILPYWILVSLISYGFLHLVIKVPGSHDTKQIILSNLNYVSSHSLSVWSLMAYSLFGILWFLVGKALFETYSGLKLISASVGVIALPMSMCFLIADGTRVGTTVGFLALLILLDESKFRNPLPKAFRLQLLGFLTLFLAMFPSILVDVSGKLRIPLRKIFEALGYL